MRPFKTPPKFENHFARMIVRFQAQLEVDGFFFFFCSKKFRVGIPLQTERVVLFALFTKVSLAFSFTLPKVACFQSFLLTHCDFCGNLSQQFNITYLLRVPARLPKEPEQVFNFLSLHNEPEPRPSRKEWSGSGCCVAIFLLPNPAPNLENRMTVCMGYTAMTSKRESRKTPPEGGRKAMQGERLNVDSSVTRKQCGQIDHIVFL